MKCIILAAGRGTRMGALCDDTPKPMLPINGKPKLAYTIEQLPDAIDEVVLIVGYLQEVIRNYFGDEYDGKKIHYVEQVELNGTAGAVALTKDIVGDDERFLAINGDDLYKKQDLTALLEEDLALLALETDKAAEYGIVLTDDHGYMSEVIEKPHDYETGLINTGTYVLPRAFFDTPLVPKGPNSDEYGLPQTVATMEGNVKVVVTREWHPIGDPETLEQAQTVIQNFI